MDLSALRDEDLQAIVDGHMDKLSDAVLEHIANGGFSEYGPNPARPENAPLDKFKAASDQADHGDGILSRAVGKLKAWQANNQMAMPGAAGVVPYASEDKVPLMAQDPNAWTAGDSMMAAAIPAGAVSKLKGIGSGAEISRLPTEAAPSLLSNLKSMVSVASKGATPAAVAYGATGGNVHIPKKAEELATPAAMLAAKKLIENSGPGKLYQAIMALKNQLSQSK